ncbi:hypothetical protein BFL40_07075 [Pseudomonas costantinii]|uniref:Uncharacterized protein n=1 Tax=Pseudomonas costantinii TaxID=168469 RepID=A0A1S2V5P6_9PSED|nr:hypothetical protein BFL40_07075 [Pseudomonas costantinii]
MDHQVFAAGQVVQQLLDQRQVGAVTVFVGLVYVGRVADQAPEHHPHAKQVGVHHPWRKGRAEKGIQTRGCAFGQFDLRPQRAGQFTGQLVVGLGDQRIDSAEVMVEQTHGHSGFGRDASYRNPGMAIAREAGEGRGNQQVPAFIGVGAAQFRRVDGHGNAFAETPECTG